VVRWRRRRHRRCGRVPWAVGGGIGDGSSGRHIQNQDDQEYHSQRHYVLPCFAVRDANRPSSGYYPPAGYAVPYVAAHTRNQQSCNCSRHNGAVIRWRRHRSVISRPCPTTRLPQWRSGSRDRGTRYDFSRSKDRTEASRSHRQAMRRSGSVPVPSR